MHTLFDLSGKVVLITGATGHLGAAMCEGLAATGAGLAVCSTSDLRAAHLASTLHARFGVRAEGYHLDLQDLDSVKRVVSDTAESFGRLDCLVNNAHFGAANNMIDMTPEEWTKGINGTLTCHWLMLQNCLPHLAAARGNVINIASMYGMVSPDPRIYPGTPYANPVNYGAGKAALLQLTRYAAVHLAGRGIRVNAISPGPFPSPAVQQNVAFVEQLASRVPLGRIGQPHELQGAVIFLASDAASYITGHNLVVDGGWTAW
ncbi:MAG: SDR family oxidoreductase [Anaerolineae bacterium]|nr:SDR family oxidoreductase [Anaerolineae bacterium]